MGKFRWRHMSVALYEAALLLLVLLPAMGLPPGVAAARSRLELSSCTLQRGQCTYRVHLTGHCGANHIPFSTNAVQNDYDERVNDIEKHLTDVSTDHTQRIKTLERKLTNLINHPLPPDVAASTTDETTSGGGGGGGGESHHHHHRRRHHGHYQQPEPDAAPTVGLKFKLDNDPSRKENELLNQLHGTFTDLRDDLRLARDRLADVERELADNRAKLNASQRALTDASAKLLLTERALEETRDERDQLAKTLHDTREECNATRAHLQSARRRVRAQGLQLTIAKREDARLRRELRELRALLEQTRRMLSEALRKYHELNLRHEAVNKELEARNEQLIDCYRGKTASSCGFEDESICGFEQADNLTDFHDWLRHSGATPSGWTGPKVDHTCGNDRGHYMYVEASTRGEGQTANLVSPKYQGVREQCVEFYYHMYGRDIGTLNVFTQVHSGDEFNPVWRAYGNQGNIWSMARISISEDIAKKGYRVIFAAILDYGYQGDIAIDDVRIFDGECYHVMTAEEMSAKFNVTFTAPATTPTSAP